MTLIYALLLPFQAPPAQNMVRGLELLYALGGRTYYIQHTPGLQYSIPYLGTIRIARIANETSPGLQYSIPYLGTICIARIANETSPGLQYSTHIIWMTQ